MRDKGCVLTSEGDRLSRENSNGLILYDAPASPCCRRCRITMLEKGLIWDTVIMQMAQMEQRSPDYLSINPNGLIPTLAHRDRIIFESGIINTYLEHQFPEVPLFPADAAGIARVRMWQSAELAMAKIFRPVMYTLNAGPIKRITQTEEEAETIARLETDDPYDLSWERKVYRLEVLDRTGVRDHLRWLLDWLEPVEAALKGRDYLVNNKFTQADIAVYPRVQMYEYIDLEISSERFPNVRRWMSLLERRDSFINSEGEAVRKSKEFFRSPMVKTLRQYFAMPVERRAPEQEQAIREYGARLRVDLGIADLLANPVKRRVLPRPAAGKLPLVQRTCEAPRSKKPGNIILYGNALSPHSQRIGLLLRYLGYTCTYREFDLAKQENRTTQFLSLNPLGEVPVLCVDELVLFDSGAIAEFLCHSIPNAARLFPNRSFELARHNMWLALETGAHKEFTPLVHEVLFKSNPAHRPKIDTAQRTYLTDRLKAKLQILELQLEGAPYLMGNALTYSDIAWYSRMNIMLKTSMSEEIQGFPAILRWRTLMETLM